MWVAIAREMILVGMVLWKILVRSSAWSLLRPARSVFPGDLSQARTLPGAVRFQSRVRSSRRRNEMSWRCHGRDNAELVANLQRHYILTSPEAATAMLKIDRGHFVPDGSPYDDCPQSIGYGVTISAPHMHAYCVSMLADRLKPGMRVLDVGSGSGYLSAVFGIMVGENGKAVGVEVIPELVERSKRDIKRTPAGPLLEKGIIEIHAGDGKLGWPAGAPYDAIHVGAAASELPKELVKQLKPGGRMVVPVGSYAQDLVLLLSCTCIGFAPF
ncbi:hypothetical protein R1flu_010440 [Riccia fluitans]|uniref:Protein-L-isoaspartate O-methyltransferase n=1 Tax=Riccia fluitans TaxID=41844 RepID=A0ABD1Z4Z6_9MARC